MTGGICSGHFGERSIVDTYVLSLVVLLVVFTVLDVAELRAAELLALGEPFQVPADVELVLGPAVAGGRAEDRLGSL